MRNQTRIERVAESAFARLSFASGWWRSGETVKRGKIAHCGRLAGTILALSVGMAHVADALLSVPVPRTAPAKAAPTRVSAPQQIASFARDGGGRLHIPGTHLLRTFRSPTLPADLAEGQDAFVAKDDDVGASIDPILQALRSADFRIDREIHFVSYRNNLNKIMETPYNHRDPWRIHLRRTQGTIYMDVVKLPERSMQSAADRDKFTFWGYKFEQLCTQDAAAEDGTNAVNANEEFCSVFKIKIGDTRIVLAAEVDCAMPPPPLPAAPAGGAGTARRGEYVELKTSRMIEHPRQQDTFHRHKLLKFWIQSFLGGVPHICCGFRDDAGLVHELRMLKTLEIPRMVRSKANMWDPGTCRAQ